MKKYISIILALIMILSILAGCGNDVRGDISNPGDSVNSPPPSDDSKNIEPDATEDEGKEIDLGTISNGAVYTNDFAGITFTLPEDWSFSTEEELAALMEDASSEMFAEDKQALLEYAKESTVYDMMAYSSEGTQNLMVMFENTARYIVGVFFSEDDYLDALESNLEMIQHLTYQVEGRSDVTLGGTGYKCLSVSVPDYGFYQDYYVRREGKYMICIAFSGMIESPGSVMGEWFS